MKNPLTQAFARTLGMDESDVMVHITHSTVQFEITNTQDYTEQLSNPDFKKNFFSNCEAIDPMLAELMDGTGTVPIDCHYMKMATDCWGTAKSTTMINAPNDMNLVCAWNPQLGCMPASFDIGFTDPNSGYVEPTIMFEDP